MALWTEFPSQTAVISNFTKYILLTLNIRITYFLLSHSYNKQNGRERSKLISCGKQQ